MTACTDEAWHTLWDHFNTHSGTDVIRVPREALNIVGACHGNLPPDLVARQPRTGSTTVEVNRAKLFEFLKSHPAICEAP